MSDLRLERLTLRNFKGVRDFTLDAGGGDAAILGDNATGKTTLFDGFLWLLFGKDSRGQADFAIKPLDEGGKVREHGIESEVEGVFSLDGETLTLRKVYAEKWTKPRGAVEREFTGHTTEYYVDGVPMQKKEYDERVREIADEDAFRLLTSPSAFNDLHWQERRKILLTVCGDLTDADVIASDKALADLPAILGKRSLDDHRKVIAARRKAINDELERIPVRIDEAARGLPEVAGLQRDAVEFDIRGAREELERAQAHHAGISAGGAVADARVRLREIEASLAQIQGAHDTETRGRTFDLDGAVQEASRKLDDARREVESAKRDLAASGQRAKEWAAKADDQRQRFRDVSAREFVEGETKTSCPSCGQALPPERIADALQHARGHFMAQRADELERIAARGREDAQEAGKWQTDAERCREVLKDAESALLGAETALMLAREARSTVVLPDIAERDDYRAQVAEKADAEAEIARLAANASGAVEASSAEIAGLQARLRELEGRLLLVDQRKAGEKRIDELAAQQKALAAEFEALERELYLTEQFVRAKVRLLEERINSRFKIARFRLFEQQINGGLQETCETLCGGVPYSGGLNNAARINVGLDIINTLSEHYGFTAPVFVDNAEAVVRLETTRGQVIALVVSERDAALRIAQKTKEAV